MSWSGEQGLLLARALTDWLIGVFNYHPDIWKWDDMEQIGYWWKSHEPEIQMRKTNFAILCLTPDSVGSERLNFEAGALSMVDPRPRVEAYRLGVKADDVGPPLSMFGGYDADEKGTLRLLESVNYEIGTPIPEDELPSNFEKWWWPSMKERLEELTRQA